MWKHSKHTIINRDILKIAKKQNKIKCIHMFHKDRKILYWNIRIAQSGKIDIIFVPLLWCKNSSGFWMSKDVYHSKKNIVSLYVSIWAYGALHTAKEEDGLN